jgi:hypothetical protein
VAVQDIYDAFHAAAGALSLSGDSLQGAADLLASLGVSALALTAGAAGEGPDSAWLTATTTYLNTEWSLRLTGRDAGGAPQYQLTLQLTAQPRSTPWTFAQAFPGKQLPPSRRQSAEPGGGLELGESIIAPLVLEQPAITAANLPAGGAELPHLQGWLVLTGSALDRYTPFLGGRLWMDGTVGFARSGAPILHVHATATGETLRFNGTTIPQVGVDLVTDYPDPAPFPDQGAPTSAALLYGLLPLPGSPAKSVKISAPLLTGDFVWPLYVSFGDPPLTLSGGAAFLAAVVAGAEANRFSLPPGLAPLDAFGVSELELGVVPSTSSRFPGITYTAVTVCSESAWDPPIPFLMIKEVGVRWVFHWASPPEDTLVTASIFGTMIFGSKKQGSLGAAPVPPVRDESDVELTIRMDLPDCVFYAWTEGDIDLPIGQGFAAYFDTQPPDVPKSLSIKKIEIEASLLHKTYEGSMVVEGSWPVTAGNVEFALTGLELWIAVSESTVEGRIAGTATVTVPGKDPVLIRAIADYPGTGHWTFEGGIEEGPLDLLRFAAAFLGVAYPSWMEEDRFSVNLVEFRARYGTAPGNPYLVRGTLAMALQDRVLGIPMSLTATAMIERRPATGGAGDARAATADGGMVTVGSVDGTFTVNRFEVAAGVNLGESEKTYTFRVTYDGATLAAATSWTGKGDARHPVLTVRLQGLTLGGIVRYFVKLAHPNANYRLDPPWDFLETIALDRAALVVDPTLQTIALTYAVDLTLPFLSLRTVGILYDRSTGSPSVRLVVEGSFLGDDRTGADALAWDPVAQAPPAVPGKGQRLFHLRYLGLGQHVTPAGLLRYDSIAGVLDTMRGAMVPVDGRPPATGTGLRFDAGSQWLFGLDCTVMDTVTLKLVLHDPDLYGVLISLAGPEAGSLAGLSFELTYRKVTAGIGVFHGRLQIPDAYRQLQFGAVSLTLGVITVDIYTNGNFRVDLGFPHNRDFSQSFAMEAGYFNGYGGIYFGLLDGATSARVPAITNGTFSPVIELGVGLMIGVGRTFRKGPLTAGLYVDLLAIFEGTLAWFHPTDAGASTAMYYWCRGTVGITGKLYGSVDFKIITVSVSVEAYATATLTLAAHQATLVELDVGVRVHASVKIVFVRISFSFSLTLHASFTIGETSPAPWALAADQSGRAQAQLTASAHAPARRRPVHVAAQTRDAYRQARLALRSTPPTAMAAVADGWHLAFNRDARVFPREETRTATLRLLPAFTVADVPVNWTGRGDPPPNPDPKYRIAFVLTADSAVDPRARTLADTHVPTTEMSSAAENPSDTTFNQVAEAMLRWSLNAAGVTSPSATVTLGQLQELVDQLALPEAESHGFTWDNLDGFLGGNLHFLLGGIPSGDEAPASIGGVPFPMVPSLQWSAPELSAPWDAMRFWEHHPVDSTYERGVLQYFSKLDPRDAADRPDVTGRLEAGAGDDAESMASFVFREYFLLTARAAAQAAVDLLSSFPHTVRAADSLGGIAGGFPTTTVQYTVIAGDGVDHVAHVLGMSSAELLALDPEIAWTLAAASPGDSIPVTLGVTPESIAGANPDRAVTEGVTVALGDLAVPIRAGDTLSSLAARYGITADAWLRTEGLLGAPGILRGGAPLAVPSFVYPNPGALSVATVAAVFHLRLPAAPAGTPVPLADWYAEAIVSLNGDEVSDAGPLPGSLKVPREYGDPTAPDPWVPLPGDTLESVAEVLALAQNTPAAGSPFAVWLNALQDANAGWQAGPVTLPGATAAVAAGDTLRTLAARLLRDDDDAAFRRLVEDAEILLPLAYVTVPGASQDAPAGQTLLSLAQYHGLSLEDLAGRAAGVAGLLAEDDKHTLAVPAVPALGLDALTAALHAGQPAATVAGQVARFMMHGLRLPAPGEAGGVHEEMGPMTGLYALTGQQVPGPPPIAGNDPATVRLTLTVTLGRTSTWLAFADSATVPKRATLAALARAHPLLHLLNPALRARASEYVARRAGTGPADAARRAGAARLPAGMIVMTGVTDSLVIALTERQLEAGYPATGLVPAFDGAIRALPPGRQVPVWYPVNHPIRWQTTVAPALPAAAGATGAAVPTLWLLPPDLMARAESGVSTDPYELVQRTPQAGPAAKPSELNAYAWGMLIDLAVHRVPGSEGTVELFGADTADRQRLALLLNYLGTFPGSSAGDFPAPPTGESVGLTLAWQLPASAGAPEGLTSTALEPARSFVVKTNLSTETHSGGKHVNTDMRAAAAPPPPPAPFASMTTADAPRFLALLWECSVVGGGGYWLHHEAPDGGTGIPDSIFDQDGRATLSLLVQVASQSGTADTGWPVRRLFAFNNTAVVGDGVDPGSVALLARSTDPCDTTPEASVQQGKVGFAIDLTVPASSGAPPAQEALQSLYSLVGYRLVETAAFDGSGEGQPLGPEVHRNEDGTPDESRWSLIRVIPITNFARALALPAVTGFPAPGDDPYAGITGASTVSTSTWVQASTVVQLWFHDMLGNTSAPPASGGGAGGSGGSGGSGDDDGLASRVTVPVGYTDPVIGPSAWPATTLRYSVTAPRPCGGTVPATANLAVAASLQAVVYQPGGAEAGPSAASRAARDRDRFARVHYQVMQPDVAAHLLTSLQQAPPRDGTESEPDLLPVSLAPLRAYATGSYALLASLAEMGAYTPAGAPTLDTVAATHGVDYDAIAAANLGTALGSVVSTVTLQVPQQAVYRTSDTVLALCGNDAMLAHAVLEDPDNVVLPLQPGTELAIPRVLRNVPDPSPSATELADGLGVSLETLVAPNAGRAALLTPGFAFDCNGFTVTVAFSGDEADATLNGVAQAFRQHWEQPYDAVTVVRMNADRPGMFRASAPLSVTGWIVRPGETLQASGSGATAARLASLNTGTAGLFPDGTPLHIRSQQRTLSATATLGDTAATLGISPGSLLRHNGAVGIGRAFAVPGLYGWPHDATTLRVPYTIRSGDTLRAIAANFPFTGTDDAPALALVRMNALVPGTLAEGRTFTVDGMAARTEVGDSFQRYADRFGSGGVGLDHLSAAMCRSGTVLQPGALLLVPPAILPAAAAPATALTPVQAAAPFGVSPTALLAANAGTPGLLAAGATLTASTADASTEVTTAVDSVTAVLRRFQRRGITTSVDALANANASVSFITPAAAALLPPADAVLPAVLGGLDPRGENPPVDAPWKFPAGIFPLHVWVQLGRQWNLVNEELRGTAAKPAAAVRARTAVPAARQGLPQDRADGGAVTLDGFATALEAAVPPVRVATGKVLGERNEGPDTDVWAVVFSDARIGAVTVTPPVTLPGVTGAQPRTFALRPLVNALVARSEVELRALDTSTGELTGSETLSFQGVDLEVWARAFLADLDLVLSVLYTPGAYVLNRTALQAIVTAKKTLAAAVAGGLDHVLQAEPGAPAAKRDAAQETLRQLLLVSLSRGYRASAVLQYDTRTRTPWSTEYARFAGASDITFPLQDPRLDLASVSNGKVSLRDGGGEVDLVVWVPDVEEHETLPMKLDFRLVEMEFNVAAEIEGYDRSDWLAFVNPVQTGKPPQVQVNLGSPTVPLPLRAYPPVATLLDHQAETRATATTVNDALEWTYRFRFQHQSAEQDEIRLEVEMNRPPVEPLLRAPGEEDLFGWLAQYTYVASPLLGILGTLQDWKGIPDPAVASAALSTFATLAGKVAGAWAGHWGVPVSTALPAAADGPGALLGDDAELVAGATAPGVGGGESGDSDGDTPAPPPFERYAFTMTLQADAASKCYRSLRLLRTQTGGPVDWPAVTCYGVDGVQVELLPGTGCGCADGNANCRCYVFPTDSTVPAFGLLTYELAFRELHVADYQSAIATVWVTRNAALFGEGGAATTEAFVYQTPQSSYPEPVVPFISIADRLEIGTWSYEASRSPLTPLFGTLFHEKPGGRRVTLGVRYGYQLAAGDPPLESYLPVKQSAVVDYGHDTVADTCASLETWFDQASPAVEGGRWAFWIDVYSTVDPSLQRPVLQFKRLISPLPPTLRELPEPAHRDP